jgi:hypothetical protein
VSAGVEKKSVPPFGNVEFNRIAIVPHSTGIDFSAYFALDSWTRFADGHLDLV